MDHEISGTLSSENLVHQGTTENSNNSVVSETVMVIRLDEEYQEFVNGENRVPNAKVKGLGSSKVSVDKRKKNDSKDKHSSVIDAKCSSGGGLGEILDRERVCRICHLSSDQSSETNNTTATNLILQLGCSCKDELGIAHPRCAEAWFRLKGNGRCEICGKTAKNITGGRHNIFMAERNDQMSTDNGSNAAERSGECWWRQPFCVYLMGCLILAFILPLFICLKFY